jgi:CO dehydrogenase/acetyl-CoA synthase beta subunit
MKNLEEFLTEEKNPAYKEWEKKRKEEMKAWEEKEKAKAKAREKREKARMTIASGKPPHVQPAMGGTGIIKSHKEFDDFIMQLDSKIR